MANVKGLEHHGHEEHGEHHEEHGHHHEEFFIHIDHVKYEVDERRIAGAEIRKLPKSPIGADYDLFLETDGPGDDEKIQDTQEAHLKHRMSFYSVPRQINPGAGHAAS
jgi:hypothetical protein